MKIHPRKYALALLLAITSATLGCKGDTGSTGPAGPSGSGPADPTDNELNATEDGPGINIAVISVDGASGSDGTFQVGDMISLTFEVTKDDGSDWDIAEFNRGRALVSGPTFNYQRVISEKSNVISVAVDNGDGTWTYSFPDPIPATYLAPVNDTASFGLEDGELTGQSLLAGTYTVGLYFRWSYSVDENGFYDVDNATVDVPFLGATTIDSREVVGQGNCNACHDSLRAHGGQRQDVTICLMCHTAGAEDRNNATLGGTPGVSVDFKVMIHKIHNGAHLPSVAGISTNPDGTRDYTATPEAYEIVGYNNSIHDYSHLEFPMWPNIAYPMGKDMGYSLLTGGEQDLEDIQRSGVTNCDACHGDPDGAGPIPAPAQGTLAYEKPTRQACGSCHDDIHWDRDYVSNGIGMGADKTDDTCLDCHPPSGPPLIVPMRNNKDAHLHPMLDPTFNPGLHFDLTSVEDTGSADDDDGTIDVGEKVEITFTMTDTAGADVDPADIGSVAVVVNGPTSNMNLLLSTSISSDALTGPQPYTLNLPAPQYLERLATGTGALDVFATDFTPLWDDAGAASTVYLRSADGFSTTLAAAAAPMQNYIDVAIGDGASFLKDEYIVIDDGLGSEEYLEIQWVDGDRLWFGSAYQTDYKPGTTMAHALGAAVMQVDLDELVLDTDYSVNVAGSYNELIEQGGGAILVASYTSDFVMPAVYPLTLNESPDVDESWGKWTGKSIVAGTYRFGIWADHDFEYTEHGEDNDYPNSSIASIVDVLVDDATTIEPFALLGEIESCYACHDDIYFHGGHRRGVDSCLQCHGAAGAEDRPQYRAPGADPTTATMVKFREMVHKIHMGANLDKADSYVVNGYGFGGAYPNNFTPHMYDEVVFPTFPGSAKHCTKCHGASNAWEVPRDFSHPTESLIPSRSWRAVCGSCHDSDAAHAHIDAQTAPSGNESCAICHDDGSELDTEFVHKPRM